MPTKIHCQHRSLTNICCQITLQCNYQHKMSAWKCNTSLQTRHPWSSCELPRGALWVRNEIDLALVSHMYHCRLLTAHTFIHCEADLQVLPYPDNDFCLTINSNWEGFDVLGWLLVVFNGCAWSLSYCISMAELLIVSSQRRDKQASWLRKWLQLGVSHIRLVTTLRCLVLERIFGVMYDQAVLAILQSRHQTTNKKSCQHRDCWWFLHSNVDMYFMTCSLNPPWGFFIINIKFLLVTVTLLTACRFMTDGFLYAESKAWRQHQYSVLGKHSPANQIVCPISQVQRRQCNKIIPVPVLMGAFTIMQSEWSVKWHGHTQLMNFCSWHRDIWFWLFCPWNIDQI